MFIYFCFSCLNYEFWYLSWVSWGSGNALIYFPLFLMRKIALELELFRTGMASRSELSSSFEVWLYVYPMDGQFSMRCRLHVSFSFMYKFSYDKSCFTPFLAPQMVPLTRRKSKTERKMVPWQTFMTISNMSRLVKPEYLFLINKLHTVKIITLH